MYNVYYVMYNVYCIMYICPPLCLWYGGVIRPWYETKKDTNALKHLRYNDVILPVKSVLKAFSILA